MDSSVGVFRWMKLKPEWTAPRKRGQTLSTLHLMRVFFSILALLTTSFFSLAQSTEPCSADELHAAEMATSEPYARNFDAVRAAVQRLQASSNRNMDVYTIPVVVHVIHRGSSVGVEENISDAQILSAIDGMNDDFRNRVSDSEGADTFIQFEMARRTPTGDPTNGIVRVDGSSVPGYAEHGISNGQDDDAADQTAVKSLTTWFGDDYINIFVVPEINGNDGGNGVQGFAYLGPTNDARDGIVVIYNAFGLVGELKPGRTLNKTITHEMGHHLSLYHTFSNTTSCTSETNCETQGDLVCDTPATIANTSGMHQPHLRRCAGGELHGLCAGNVQEHVLCRPTRPHACVFGVLSFKPFGELGRHGCDGTRLDHCWIGQRGRIHVPPLLDAFCHRDQFWHADRYWI